MLVEELEKDEERVGVDEERDERWERSWRRVKIGGGVI